MKLATRRQETFEEQIRHKRVVVEFSTVYCASALAPPRSVEGCLVLSCTFALASTSAIPTGFRLIPPQSSRGHPKDTTHLEPKHARSHTVSSRQALFLESIQASGLSQIPPAIPLVCNIQPKRSSSVDLNIRLTQYLETRRLHRSNPHLKGRY